MTRMSCEHKGPFGMSMAHAHRNAWRRQHTLRSHAQSRRRGEAAGTARAREMTCDFRNSITSSIVMFVTSGFSFHCSITGFAICCHVCGAAREAVLTGTLCWYSVTPLSRDQHDYYYGGAGSLRPLPSE